VVLTDFPNSCPVSGRFLPLDHNISLSGTGFRSMHRYIPHCRYTDSVSLYFHLRRHCQMHHSCKLSQVFLLCLSDDLPFTVLFLSSLHQISKLLIHQTKRNDYILHNFSIITMYSGSVVKTKI